MADIVINASPKKALSVELVGIEYMVKPPKMSVLAVVAKAAGQKADGQKTIQHIENLVKIMFKGSAERVLARLEDPMDDLDYQDIMNTAEAVIEASTGNPTSSPQDSSQQSPATGNGSLVTASIEESVTPETSTLTSSAA